MPRSSASCVGVGEHAPRCRRWRTPSRCRRPSCPAPTMATVDAPARRRCPSARRAPWRHAALGEERVDQRLGLLGLHALERRARARGGSPRRTAASPRLRSRRSPRAARSRWRRVLRASSRPLRAAPAIALQRAELVRAARASLGCGRRARPSRARTPTAPVSRSPSMMRSIEPGAAAPRRP